MTCPSCGAAVEDGADLCLECGEPMGDSPAARVARSENVIRPPADVFTPTPVPGRLPAAGRPAPTPPPRTAPTTPVRSPPAPTPPPRSAPPPPPTAKPGAPPPKPVVPTAKAALKRPLRIEEPEPRRCPGCGTKSFAVRCPGCGTRLRSDDDE